MPPGSRIADIRCHRLYFAALLVDRSYVVHGFDATEVIDNPLTRRNAEICGAELYAVDDLAHPNILGSQANVYDCAVLLETIEHLAFNPLTMWKWIVNMVRPGGAIIITTPNSMRWSKRKRDLDRLVLGQGYGIVVPEIFDAITRGHHWKEFSASEVKDYFRIVGIPSECIDVKLLEYNKPRLRKRIVLSVFPSLRDKLFITVRMPDLKPIVREEPTYWAALAAHSP